MNKIFYPSLDLANKEKVAGSHVISMEKTNSEGIVIRQYTYFTDPVEIYDFIYTRREEDRNFHEIVESNVNVKFYMDIDIDPNNLDILEELTGLIVDSMEKIFRKHKLLLRMEELLLLINNDSAMQIRDRNSNTQSTGKTNVEEPLVMKKKQSVHLVYTYLSFQNLRVIKHLVKQICDMIPEKYAKYIDQGVYKKNQSFRMPFCCKTGKSSATMYPIIKWSHKGETYKWGTDMKSIFVKGFIQSKAIITVTSIEVPSETKVSDRLKIPPEDLKMCLNVIKDFLGDTFPCFEVSFENESFIKLRRLKPSSCVVCEDGRMHESIGQYAFLTKSRKGITLIYGCYRTNRKKSKLLKEIY